MADPRDEQIDDEAIMMNLIAGGDKQMDRLPIWNRY